MTAAPGNTIEHIATSHRASAVTDGSDAMLTPAATAAHTREPDATRDAVTRQACREIAS
jgi:hypothetical protein